MKIPRTKQRFDLSRRDFLAATGAFGLSTWAGSSWAESKTAATVIDEPWARIDKVGEGVWAVMSKPLDGHFETVCNGGIVAGRERTLVFEGFNREEGSKWVAEQAKKLTGRLPTDVVVSHFHSDHNAGLTGFALAGETPRVHMTSKTLELIRQTEAAAESPPDEARQQLLATTVLMGVNRSLDLGGRIVKLRTRQGHTPSDVTVEIDDPSVVFWGDLLWIGMFPNYMHATPSQLTRTVAGTVREQPTVNVTGHGPLASPADVRQYRALLDHVENAARSAHQKGQTAAEAGAAYRLPESISDWVFFTDDFAPNAMAAWYRELDGPEPETAPGAKSTG